MQIENSIFLPWSHRWLIERHQGFFQSNSGESDRRKIRPYSCSELVSVFSASVAVATSQTPHPRINTFCLLIRREGKHYKQYLDQIYNIHPIMISEVCHCYTTRQYCCQSLLDLVYVMYTKNQQTVLQKTLIFIHNIMECKWIIQFFHKQNKYQSMKDLPFSISYRTLHYQREQSALFISLADFDFHLKHWPSVAEN